MNVLGRTLFDNIPVPDQVQIHDSNLKLIYKTFPRKVGPRRAMDEIAKAIKRLQNGENGTQMSYEEAVQGLMAATQVYAQSPAGNRGHFTPHPSTWFHQSRYLDDPKEWNRDDTIKTKQDETRARNLANFAEVRRRFEVASENAGRLSSEGEGDARGNRGLVPRSNAIQPTGD